MITLYLARLTTTKIQIKITRNSGLPKIAPLFAHTSLGPMLIKRLALLKGYVDDGRQGSTVLRRGMKYDDEEGKFVFSKIS